MDNDDPTQVFKEQTPLKGSAKCSFTKRIYEKICGPKKQSWRNLIAYWILGLCNNYGYVVMLTAAQDILDEHTQQSMQLNDVRLNNTLTQSLSNPSRECNSISTGAILLADILPSLIIKFMAPFLPFYVHVRVFVCILLSGSGFLMVAFSKEQWMAITGVVLTSLASGLGEVTFLQYSSYFNKDVVSTWSSGTGGAGVVGAISYTGLTRLGPRNALLMMLIAPIIMGISFWAILSKPNCDNQEQNSPTQKTALTFKKKINYFPRLLKYMIPLGLVYLFEYFINQGLMELIKFDQTLLTKEEQYRWLQVDYQVGVFISRSSVNILHIKKIWIMSLLQLINVIFFTTEAIFFYIPTFWLIFILTLWEGLLGGAAYVNTFYRIPTEVDEDYTHFAMGTTAFADSIGITLAGILAIFAHNQICQLPLF